MPRLHTACHLLIAACGFLGSCPPALAAPYRPADDGQILERLPTRLLGAEQKTLRELRSRLQSTPQDAQLAADLAERYYRLAQRTGDPRYIGYAQSVLLPWPAGSAAPPEIRTVRAQVAQFLHDFDAALADLDAVLATDPANLGARSYRAIIQLVKADYAKASADCKELERRIRGLVAGACLPTVAAVTGQAESALATLAQLLKTYPAAPANEKLWVFNRLAEINQRLGRAAAAEHWYRQALAIGITDQYLLATYAEFLLDQRRATEVVELLKAHVPNDVLLLRLALAEATLGAPAAAEHRAMLTDRYEASRRRSDKLHLADEALFALHLDSQPAAALRLAQENWAMLQREPSDARVFLEAALAARDPAAAKPALDWLNETGHQDVVIRRLAGQLAELGRGQP